MQQLKLTVDERGGGLGAEAPTLQFAVRGTQLVFLARGAGPYTLALGNPTATAANLPLATLIPDYSPQRLKELGQAKVEGAAQLTTSTAASPDVAVASGPDWKKIGLWAVLLLGVLALAGMALSLLRKPAVKS